MKRFNLLIFSFFTVFSLHAAGEKITYTLSMPEPYTHYFEVEMVLENFSADELQVKMPVWAPGSYLVREFSKNVDYLTAKNSEGNVLNSYKTTKNTWAIKKGDADKVVINYNVYAFEMSVRTSFLDADHGYVNGTSVFMFVEGHEETPSTLIVKPYKDWKLVSTSLEKVSESSWTFKAEDYDQLADSPIEIGNHKELEFVAAGVPHRVALYGRGNYDESRLKTDLKNIVEGLTDIFDDNPNEQYLFIVHNLDRGSGGLEHMNSTTLQVNRWTYSPESSYDSFLGLAAHEYIHLWLVKRLRPEALGPFDYDEENYTHLLWVMEGFTSYLSQLILCHLEYKSEMQIINMLEENFTSMENTPGNRVQPVSMASFDAWIKAYRPNENSLNTQVSYYLKGSVLASLLDILIINNSDTKHNLGTVLKYLYEEHYKKYGSGITDEEMKAALEKFAQTDLDDFYARYVNGTEEIDYDYYLNMAGLALQKIPAGQELVLGANLSDGGGKTTVKSVKKGTPAWNYGLNADDEIIAVDGYRVNSSEINKILNNRKEGDTLDILIARDGLIKDLEVVLEEDKTIYYKITKENDAGKKDEKVLRHWLRDYQ